MVIRIISSERRGQMNNFVFNSLADELKASIYAQSPDTSLRSLKLDSSDRLLVGGAVTLENSNINVTGKVTVDSVADSVTISSITNPVTIANPTLTTLIGGSVFTSDSVINASITGSGSIFNNTDISTKKAATMFIYNEGNTALNLSLQMSPTMEDKDYIDDPFLTSFTVPAGGKKVVIISYLSHYIRLQYSMGSLEGVITAYYNAQS